jgi:hypothetical protein
VLLSSTTEFAQLIADAEKWLRVIRTAKIRLG